MGVASYLVDKSALARIHRPAVAARLVPMIESGMVATCAVVELELRFSARDHAELRAMVVDRKLGYEWLAMPDEVWDRALEVQGELSARGQLRAVGIPDLLIAATAERHQVAVLHHDADFDLVAAVTRQPCEWVVPHGSVA